MPHVAHVGIQLQYDENPDLHNTWHNIKQCNGIEYRWMFSDDKVYHVIAGVFENPKDALNCAKQLYVSLFYELFEQGFHVEDAGCDTYETRIVNEEDPITDKQHYGEETYFFYNKNYQGGYIGPGVYEVESSLDEFADYDCKHVTINIGIKGKADLCFDNADRIIFSYSKEAQELFHTILLAEKTYDLGMRMTMYCGLLEHLAEEKDKDPDVIDEIDKLIKSADKSSLPKDKKTSLIQFLESGKRISARSKCYNLCKKYAKDKYGKYKCKDIVSDAYSLRSMFSHGKNCNYKFIDSYFYMKFVVLDVIKGYMQEKEKTDA